MFSGAKGLIWANVLSVLLTIARNALDETGGTKKPMVDGNLVLSNYTMDRTIIP